MFAAYAEKDNEENKSTDFGKKCDNKDSGEFQLNSFKHVGYVSYL